MALDSIIEEENIVKSNINVLTKYDLSPVQKKLFTHHQFFPEDPSYNLTYCYEIKGEIDLERFVAVWERIYGNAGVFKVHFELIDNSPVQVLDPDRKITLEVEYLPSTLSVEQWERIVIDYSKELSQSVIKLDEWPLGKFKVFYNEKQSYFSICFPHIIFDGYSGYHKFNLFTKYYNSNKTIEEIDHDLREEIQEYAYFSIHSEEFSRHNDRAIEYFKEELKGFEDFQIEELEQKRDVHGRLIGYEKNFDLTSDVSEQIEKYINRNNLTDFSFFLSAYLIMLHKLFSKDKIVTGIPLANRTRKNKTVFGYFVNSLPLAINFQDIQTFQDLCLVVKRKTMSLIRYQSFDINSYMKEILAENVHSTVLFNTLFTFYTQKLSFDIEHCQVTQLPIRTEFLNFPLSSSVEKIENIYRVRIQYGSYLKDANLDKIFSATVKNIIKDENQKISSIELMTVEEKKSLQRFLNPNQRFSLNTTLHEKFTEQALTTPSKVAIKDGNQYLTYKQLDEKSNQIAHLIDEKFCKSEKYIAVSLHRSHNLVAVILGILKSGRAYVPVDPIMPIARLNYILSDLGYPPCITYLDVMNKLENEKSQLYCLEDLEEEINTMSKLKPNINVHDKDLAYIIYTSGSTGNPKGVLVSHHNVLRSFQAVKKDITFSEEDTWVLYHSYGFDPSVWEIFGSLLFGGKLIIVDELSRKAPDKMLELLINENITILQMTPSAFNQIIDVVKARKDKEEISLRYILLGGETLNFHQLKPWIDKYGDQCPKLFNVYGPTETTILATYYQIKANEIANVIHSIIGRPLLDVELLVKNKYMDDLPIGIAGELYIGGAGVSSGYYNREDLTKHRFIENQVNDGKFYKTGDEVKILPNGTLEFIERIDRQIQLRGYRVELGEIEFILQQHPACKDCIVNVHTFHNNDKRLVAYIVLKEGERFQDSSLKSYLRSKLPEYMVPSLFYEISRKPMTVNGKVDYASLPKPEISVENHSIDEMTVTEKIKQIWKDVLKIDNVNEHDNFFDIGGTSILITEVFYKLNNKQQYKKLSMLDLFQYPTPLLLGNYLNQLEETSSVKNEQPQTSNRKEALKRRKLMNKR